MSIRARNMQLLETKKAAGYKLTDAELKKLAKYNAEKLKINKKKK